ncbi:hypothetical protein J6A64_03165 [bacterium]|nr:hypothetical protein [bacterium]MBQ2872327.1 hypothetical protein [bacterium]
MGNQYIMQLRIQLSGAKKEFKEHKIKIARLLNELQANINPFFGDDVESINAEAIEQIGDELLKCRDKAVELQSQIKEITKDLGDE